jgi:glucose-1-phosphate thymidylyltransferase
MKALILAAGYATRLYPLTKDRPKSLLIVGKKTIMDHLVQKLESLNEIDSVYIVTNQRFHGLFEGWLKMLKTKKRVVLDNDGSTTNENRLGALGDIRLVLERENVNDDIMVLAGDNMFDWDLRGFIEAAKVQPGLFAMGAYDINDKEKANRYGVVELDDKGNVANFLEKPRESPSSLVATGIYYFPKDGLDLITDYLKIGNEKDAPGHFIQWLHKEHEVRCHVFKGVWYDIGDIESYRKANLSFSN